LFLSQIWFKDGGFTLEVNGDQVINRSDVYYRDAVETPSPTTSSTKLVPTGPPDQSNPSPSRAPNPTTTSTEAPSSTPDSDGLAGLLDGLLGGLLGGLGVNISSEPSPNSPPTTFFDSGFELAHSSRPVGFTGLFFSTFFGGHEEKYASPKDQFAWFKEFAMTINN